MEEEKKTMFPKTGTCRFCGKQIMLEFANEDVSQETVDEEATRNCKCDASRSWRDFDNNKRVAMQKVDAILADQPHRAAIVKKFIDMDLQWDGSDEDATDTLIEKAQFVFDEYTLTLSLSKYLVTVKKRTVKEVKL